MKERLKLRERLAIAVITFAIIIFLSALLSAQKVTVTFADGTSGSISYPSGGTLNTPKQFAKNIKAIDLPDRKGIMLCAPGTGQLYKTIEVDRSVVFIPGSLRDGTKTIYIPDDPMAYRKPWGNEITDFEVIPILFHHDSLLAPTQAKIAQAKLEFSITTQFHKILEFPRLAKLLQNLDDKQQPESTPYGQTDMGWLLHHWGHTAGGMPRIGWHNGSVPRGGGGYDNNHYNRLQYLLYNYLNDPKRSLYEFGMRQIITTTAYGRTWFGPNAGFKRYEKGDKIIGEGFNPAAWEKQWSGDMISWYRLTGHPILEMQIDLMRQQLKRSNPDLVWQRHWGARRGARYLEELLVHYLHRREAWIVDKAGQFIANCLAWRAEDLCWDNVGNGGAAPESPWMQTQLITAIFRWYEHAAGLKTKFPVDELMKSAEAIWTKGSHTLYGKPMLYYRFRTTKKLAPSMHLTAFALPMLRYMAATDRSKWGKTSFEVETFVTEYAGSTVGEVAAEIKTPISLLGHRFPREGHGWYKAYLFYFEGMR